MKMLLEVVQDDNGKVRFNTDLKMKDIPQLGVLPGMLAFNMMTFLRGDNETLVLGVIRTLAIADLAASVNRKQMIRYLDEMSKQTADVVSTAYEEMKKCGIKVDRVKPIVKSSKNSN